MAESHALSTIPMGSVDAVDSELAVYEGMLKMAGTLVQSGLLPSNIKTPAAALAIMLTGRELGWPPMKALRLLYNVDGKITMSSDAMMGLINQWCRQVEGDAYIRVTDSTNDHCTVEYKRPDWSGSQSVTYSIDDAKRAGLLGKNNWQKYPRDMLRARAQAVACRMGFADVIGGFYDPDEISTAATIHEVPRNEQRMDTPLETTGNVVDRDKQRRDHLMKTIHAWGNQVGLTHENLSGLACHYAGDNYTSMADIPFDTLGEVFVRIKEAHKLNPGEVQSFAAELSVDPDTGEILDGDFTEVAPAVDPEADKAKRKAELWRMANGTWGWSKDDLNAVSLELMQTVLSDLTGEQLTDLYRKLVVMGPDERAAVLDVAKAAVTS